MTDRRNSFVYLVLGPSALPGRHNLLNLETGEKTWVLSHAFEEPWASSAESSIRWRRIA